MGYRDCSPGIILRPPNKPLQLPGYRAFQIDLEYPLTRNLGHSALPGS